MTEKTKQKMKRDPISELYSIGRISGHQGFEKMLHEWVHRYIKSCSVRYYHYNKKEQHSFLKYAEEKNLAELTQAIIKEGAMDSTIETETANILQKTVMVLGDFSL